MRQDQSLDSCIVSNLRLIIIENSRQHCACFDNFFISYQLLVDLKEKQFRTLWTICENRFMKSPMTSSKAFQKKKRGFYDSYSEKNVVVVQWNDNRVVHMASNFAGVQPINAVKRYSQRQKKRIDVSQFHCFMRYNQGVNLSDCFIS